MSEKYGTDEISEIIFLILNNLITTSDGRLLIGN
jgi:hypothetical protein